MTLFCLKNSISLFLSSSGNRTPTKVVFSVSDFSKGITSSLIVVSGLLDSSSIYFMYADRRSFNCYLSSAGAIAVSPVCFKAVEKHFFAEVWLPLMSIV